MKKLQILVILILGIFLSIQSATATMTYGATTATASGDYTLDGIASSAFSFGPSITTGSIVMGSGLTSGIITIGGTSAIGAITLGQSTDTNTINIGNANTADTKIQTINIGAGTPAGSGKALLTIGNLNGLSRVMIYGGTSHTGATADNVPVLIRPYLWVSNDGGTSVGKVWSGGLGGIINNSYVGSSVYAPSIVAVENWSTVDNTMAGVQFQTKDTGGTVFDYAKIAGIATNHTTGAVSGSMAFTVRNNNARLEAVRIKSDGSVGLGTTDPTELLDINSNVFRLRTAKTPDSSSDTCDQGEIAWDSGFIYVCAEANGWKRASISSW